MRYATKYAETFAFHKHNGSEIKWWWKAKISKSNRVFERFIYFIQFFVHKFLHFKPIHIISGCTKNIEKNKQKGQQETIQCINLKINNNIVRRYRTLAHRGKYRVTYFSGTVDFLRKIQD